MSLSKEKLLETLRCPACQGKLSNSPGQSGKDEGFACTKCGEKFPVIGGIPRMLLSPLREALLGQGEAKGTDEQQVQTALSFGFEWQRFPEMYEAWNETFLRYMQPHGPDFFKGKKVLDAGSGTGRFAYYAAKYGAEVWAVDLGPAIEVTRRNTEDAGVVQAIQADLHRLPFELESFDFIYSIGVLHHLPDPEPAFQNLMRFLRPGGEIQIYLYWKPEGQPLKRAMLAGITALRQITTRLPHAVVHGISYPAALTAFGLFVLPYKLLKQVPGTDGFAEKIPMKQYASLPFRVCVNDQLDRLSAPIENRYTKQQVHDWLRRARLEEPEVNEYFGWTGGGRKPQKAPNG